MEGCFMSQVNNKGTALVTGASTGIGATYADRLAKRGYNLILTARDADRLRNLAEKIRATGTKVEILPADLGTKAGRAAVESRFALDPEISLLVNNAGMAIMGPLAATNLDQAEALIALNIIAATRLAKAAAAAFAARKAGAIINIASVVAFQPGRISAVYSASKAYVLNLSQAMEAELTPLGVRVQAVLPGATRTEIWGRAGADIDALPPEVVMGVDEMVDASLAGFDLGETVTIPALPDNRDWQAFEAARLAMGPNLSRNHAAARYQVAA
jgi:short-subunit dehydrogenase